MILGQYFLFTIKCHNELQVIHSGIVDLSKSAADILEKHIVPSKPLFRFQQASSFVKRSSFVVKRCRFGNCNGIMRKTYFKSRAEFLEYMYEVSVREEYINHWNQRESDFHIMNRNGNLESVEILGSLVSVDGCFSGPRLFRCSKRKEI